MSLSRRDGERVAQTALDAVAAVGERFVEPVRLVRVQIALTVRTPTGKRTVVTAIKERKP
jgi:DNA-binding protein